MLNDKWYRIAASRAYGYLEVPSIGWQLFILESYQSDSTAFPSCLDTYATRLLTEPLSVRSLLVAIILGSIRFAVLEVTIRVVVLGVLTALIRSRLPGQDRRSHEPHGRQQLQKHHQPSQLILLSKASTYYFLTVRAKILLSIRAVP